MLDLPDLSELSSLQKDDLIRSLWPLQQKVQDLTLQLAELQSRLNLNSRNSSKPPSSDGLNKPAPKSLRVARQNPTGGPKGHTGSTLKQSANPDKIVIHGVPTLCQACQKTLPPAYMAEARQVYDLPEVKCEVTEHQAMRTVCSCGRVHTGEFPVGVTATVQYGPRVQAAMAHLNQNHAVPLQRTAVLMEDFFDLQVEQAVRMPKVKQKVSGGFPGFYASAELRLNFVRLHQGG